MCAKPFHYKYLASPIRAGWWMGCAQPPKPLPAYTVPTQPILRGPAVPPGPERMTGHLSDMSGGAMTEGRRRIMFRKRPASPVPSSDPRRRRPSDLQILRSVRLSAKGLRMRRSVLVVAAPASGWPGSSRTRLRLSGQLDRLRTGVCSRQIGSAPSLLACRGLLGGILRPRRQNRLTVTHPTVLRA